MAGNRIGGRFVTSFFRSGAAILVILCALPLGSLGARAADYLIENGVTETTPIELLDDGDTLTIEDGGTLSVSLEDYAVGALADDFIITNAGNIFSSDTISGSIYVSASTGGLIHNEATGIIDGSSITAIHIENSSLSILNEGDLYGGRGIEAISNSTLEINNSGDIEAIVTGIDINDSLVSALINTGTIQGDNQYGLRLRDTTVSFFSNEGRIEGEEEGLHQHASILTGINSGTIIGGEVGISVHEGSILDLINSGTIQGTGDHGVYIYDVGTEATIVNTGAIYGGANGITVENAKLDLVNAGIISGVDRSLDIEDSSGNTVTLLPGSVLIGDIYLGNADNSFIFGNGLNALLSFNTSGSLPANIDTNGMPYVVDAANYQIAIVDTTGFAMADEILEDLTGSVMGAVSKRLHAPDSAGSSSVALSAGETIRPASYDMPSGHSIWGEVLGSWREQDASAPAWSSEHRLSGIVTGFDGALSDVYRAGLFIGAAQSELEVDDNAQEIDAHGLFGGAYVSRSDEQIIADLTIFAGWQEHDSERLVANNALADGLETAEASYDGFFIAPELTVGMKLPVITPTFTLRYAGLFLEDYEEVGSAAALTVDSRAVHNLTSRAQLALPLLHELSDGSSMSLDSRVGVEGRFTFGGDVSAVLLTDTISFEPGGDDAVASLYAGTDAALRSAGGGVTLRLGAEASAGTDGSLIFGTGLGGEIAF